MWQQQLDLSGSDDPAALVTVDADMVFVHSQAEQTFDLRECCLIGRWVVQGLAAANGKLVWQTAGNSSESGVYNMVADGARLFVPGRKVDNATNNWDFLVRVYDIGGPRFEIEPAFVAPRLLTAAGTSGRL